MEPEKWNNFSIFKQLGNIASEISRAEYWEESGSLVEKNNSLERSLDLIDLTIISNKENNRLKELLYLREAVADIFAGTKNYQITLGDLIAVLMPFAFKARD